MKYIIYALIIAIVLPTTVFVYAVNAPTPILDSSKVLKEVGNVSGATCDVQQAYAFLEGKTTTAHGYNKSISKLDPEFACRLAAFFKATGCGPIFSGVRTRADQQRALKANGGKGVNRYETSCHTYGLAVDVSGCYPYKDQMAKYGLHFPYSSKSHIQCVEHTAPRCSVSTRSCSGEVGRVSVNDVQKQYQQDSTTAQNKDTKQKGQGVKASSLPKSTSGATSQNQTPQTAVGEYDPYGVWGSNATTTTQSRIANISCTPSSISGAEPVTIEWSCGGASTRSRGGTTNRNNIFSTGGELKNIVRSRPSVGTGYKVQCLKGDVVLDEAACRVDIDTSTPKQSKAAVLYIDAKDKEVEQGGRTSVRWVAIGARDCAVVKGGAVVGEGDSGSIYTEELYSDTTYVLQCETNDGSKSKPAEVTIR